MLAVAALAALAMEIVRKGRLDRFGDRLKPHAGGWRKAWVVRLGREQIPVTVPAGTAVGNFSAEVEIDGRRLAVTSDWQPGEGLWHGTIGGSAVSVQVRPAPAGATLSWRGVVTYARAMLPATAALDALMPEKTPPDMSRYLLCPMPGLVVSIAVAEGQEVKAGETLAVVEAMKMENVLRAERDGTVKAVNAKPGDSLAVDAVILEFA